MSEVWRTAGGGAYEVSSEGRVRRIGKKPLVGRPHTNGYVRVCLGKGVERYVHRLVCEAFHGAPFEGAHADHINGIRDDNRAENLRWVTPEENRASRACAHGEAHPHAKLTEDFVRDLRAGRLNGSDRQIAVTVGVARETIRDARNGKLWRHVA